jgi:protein-tyrosine phosphatase
MNKNDIDEIFPHLYISNWYTSNNEDVILKNNIKAVITLETRPKPQEIKKFYSMYGIDYIYINIGDMPNENIYKYFNMTYDFIKQYTSNHQNVLVHCYAGISRSASIILNYIIKDTYINNINNMKVYNESPGKIVNYILLYAKEKRYIINPNEGFLRQLIYAASNYKNHNFILQ